MPWFFFGTLAAVAFGLYNFFTKLTADKFSPSVGYLFLTGTAFLVGLIMTLYLKMTGQPITFTRTSVYLPILAGLATGGRRSSI